MMHSSKVLVELGFLLVADSSIFHTFGLFNYNIPMSILAHLLRMGVLILNAMPFRMWLDPSYSDSYSYGACWFMSGITNSPKRLTMEANKCWFVDIVPFPTGGPACSTSAPWFFHRKQLPSQTAVSIRLVFRTRILGPVKMHVLKVRRFFRKNRNKGSSKVGRVFVVFSCIFPPGGPPKTCSYKDGVVGWNNPRNHIFFEAIYRGSICKTPWITIGGFWAHLASPEAWSFNGAHTSEAWHT